MCRLFLFLLTVNANIANCAGNKYLNFFIVLSV